MTASSFVQEVRVLNFIKIIYFDWGGTDIHPVFKVLNDDPEAQLSDCN
jgi:hypothetical protein